MVLDKWKREKKQQKPGGIHEHGMCRTHDTQRLNCQIKWIKIMFPEYRK